MRVTVGSLSLLLAFAACGKSTPPPEPAPAPTRAVAEVTPPAATVADVAPAAVADVAPPAADVAPAAPKVARLLPPGTTTVTGFADPAGVLLFVGGEDERHLFVSNLNGDAQAKDDNGFISQVALDGTVIALKWIDGAAADVELHAPSQMDVIGGILYVQDGDGVRAFDPVSGKPVPPGESAPSSIEGYASPTVPFEVDHSSLEVERFGSDLYLVSSIAKGGVYEVIAPNEGEPKVRVLLEGLDRPAGFVLADLTRLAVPVTGEDVLLLADVQLTKIAVPDAWPPLMKLLASDAPLSQLVDDAWGLYVASHSFDDGRQTIAGKWHDEAALASAEAAKTDVAGAHERGAILAMHSEGHDAECDAAALSCTVGGHDTSYYLRFAKNTAGETRLVALLAFEGMVGPELGDVTAKVDAAIAKRIESKSK